ncbi:MAG: 3-deoxy-D-manno-octulosonate cytidylyltransferase [Planctomycetota bacterium]|jgi:3-deoxy-D-manno-octulosonate cytidylyltransferase|uniref:3-deoxy-manno-octulosonate cytidylyltransferase n=1 Tax=Patiriisocius sp. Uisw_047 TaxID=3230969 RepID=UPI0039E873C1
MKIIAMIPARYEASRFPAKLMQLLGEKTVILTTYEATVATGLFSEVYVVTDSELIASEITNNGGNAIMSRTPHECGSDRIAEAVAGIDCDIVLNVQGDEPFTNRKSLENLLAVFNGADAAKIDLASIRTSISKEEDINNPNCVKVVTGADGFAKYFSRAPIPYNRAEDKNAHYFKHVGIYAFRKQAILDFAKLEMSPLEAAEKIECLRFLENGRQIKMVVSKETTFGIDTPKDLIKANDFLKNNKH